MLLYQPKEGYCYNSDTIFLFDFICRFHPKGDLLDIGSGSGVLGLLLARDFKIRLHATEKQSKMAFLTKKNAQINQIDIELREGDFLEQNFEKQFDFIVSNPPFYHPDVLQSEQEAINISRYAHHLPLDGFVKKINQIIKPRGHLVFCYDAKQLQRVFFALAAYHLTVETLRLIHPKHDKLATLAMIQARKNSRSMMKILPPLYVFEGEEFSAEAMEIFKRARTHSIKCHIG